MQEILDTALARATDEQHSRFEVSLTAASERCGQSEISDPPPEWPKLSALVPENIDADDLAAIRQHIDHLLAMGSRFGGGRLVDVAASYFCTVHRQLGASYCPPEIERELQVLAGELAEVAGWLAFDAGDDELTRKMNQEAFYFTRISGDKQIELLTLQNAAMHAGVLGHPREELQLANSVLNGQQRLTPRVRALFLTRQARALAQGGDHTAMKVFAEVESLYLDGTCDDDPDWAWWVDERELAWHHAMTHQHLGNHKHALGYFEKAATTQQPKTQNQRVRIRYEYGAHLLRAQIAVRTWHDATATMHQLEPLARDVGSTRTVNLLRQALAALPHTNAPHCVAEQAQQLSTALNASPV
jgi:tetratricopeptide (TPR) repeat protein